jgi:hypothetical protein
MEFQEIDHTYIDEFSRNKKTSVSKVDWKRNDLVDDALEYIRNHPSPTVDSVIFNKDKNRFFLNPAAQSSPLPPPTTIIASNNSNSISNSNSSNSNTTYSMTIERDDNESSVTFEATSHLGTITTPSHQDSPFLQANQPFGQLQLFPPTLLTNNNHSKSTKSRNSQKKTISFSSF